MSARTQSDPEAMPRPEAVVKSDAQNLPPADDPRQTLPIRRGAQVEIRLSLREHKGHEFIDLRAWFADEDGEWIPSRRGFTVPPPLWSAFLAIVVEMDRRLRVAGVVAEEEEVPDGDDE